MRNLRIRCNLAQLRLLANAMRTGSETNSLQASSTQFNSLYQNG